MSLPCGIPVLLLCLQFINLNAFVAWDPGYVNVGVIVFLQKLMGAFGEKVVGKGEYG